MQTEIRAACAKIKFSLLSEKIECFYISKSILVFYQVREHPDLPLFNSHEFFTSYSYSLFVKHTIFGENQSMTETGEKKMQKDLQKKLESLIETFDVANVLTEPITKSIENLLRLSAAEMNSEEASVLIRDGNEGDLRFLTAIGKVADKLLNLRVPAGKGIAGFVLSSGQPMAVADVGEERAFYDEVDRKTGYSTQTILATPLRHNGEIIGVLEYVNRIGDPPFQPFSPDDMDNAALFAEAIASLVNAYESAKLFRELGNKLLNNKNETDYVEIRNWLRTLRDSEEHREMMDLAVLLREIAARGESERQLCREILESILRFSDTKTETSFLSF